MPRDLSRQPGSSGLLDRSRTLDRSRGLISPGEGKPGSSSRGSTGDPSNPVIRDSRMGTGREDDPRASRGSSLSRSRDSQSGNPAIADPSNTRSRDALGGSRLNPSDPTRDLSRGSSSGRTPGLADDRGRSSELFRRPPGDTADTGRTRELNRGLGSRGSSRGSLDRSRLGGGVNPSVADINSALRTTGGRNPEFLPPPPPPPIGGHYFDNYYDNVYDHYNHYSPYWFGGAHSWRSFISACAPAPWFSSHYSYVHSWPWVYGYYEPYTYVSSGWWTPRWYGRTYYPWWSWCSAPFVYYYYSYPARFSFHVSIGSGYSGGSYGYSSGYSGGYYDDYYYDDYYDDGYYDDGYYYDDDYYYDPTGYDIYDGGASIVMAAVDRPLGVWVPGHWEEQYVLKKDWVWVPGHYVY